MCELCYADRPSALTHTLECGHSACKPCLKTWLSARIEERGTEADLKPALRCPFASETGGDNACQLNQRAIADASEIAVEPLPQISAVFAEQCDFASLNNAARQLPEIRCCPADGCDGLGCWSSKTCVDATCAECGLGWQEEFRAPFWRRGLRKFLQLDDESVQNAEAELFLQSNTKPCPLCTAPIEKNGGCKHMTCKACGCQFCWICTSGGPLSASNMAWQSHSESSCTNSDGGNQQTRRHKESSARIRWYKQCGEGIGLTTVRLSILAALMLAALVIAPAALGGVAASEICSLMLLLQLMPSSFVRSFVTKGNKGLALRAWKSKLVQWTEPLAWVLLWRSALFLILSCWQLVQPAIVSRPFAASASAIVATMFFVIYAAAGLGNSYSLLVMAATVSSRSRQPSEVQERIRNAKLKRVCSAGAELTLILLMAFAANNRLMQATGLSNLLSPISTFGAYIGGTSSAIVGGITGSGGGGSGVLDATFTGMLVGLFALVSWPVSRGGRSSMLRSRASRCGCCKASLRPPCSTPSSRRGKRLV